MRKPEQNLWQSVKRNLGKHFVLERVENIATDGMPDVHGIRYGCEFWIELKVARPVKRAYSKSLLCDDVRPAQINWHQRFAENGGYSFVIIKFSERVAMVPGWNIESIIDATQQEIIDNSCAVGWQEIREALTECCRG